jgi:hypothetical protein
MRMKKKSFLLLLCVPLIGILVFIFQTIHIKNYFNNNKKIEKFYFYLQFLPLCLKQNMFYHRMACILPNQNKNYLEFKIGLQFFFFIFS